MYSAFSHEKKIMFITGSRAPQNSDLSGNGQSSNTQSFTPTVDSNLNVILGYTVIEA